MLVVRYAKNENGTHDNANINSPFYKVPDGWFVIPKELEEEALKWLPFVVLTLDETGTNVVSVAQDKDYEKQEPPEAEAPSPSIEERLGAVEEAILAIAAAIEVSS